MNDSKQTVHIFVIKPETITDFLGYFYESFDIFCTKAFMTLTSPITTIVFDVFSDHFTLITNAGEVLPWC